MSPSDLRRKLHRLRGHLRRLILLAGASRVVLAVAGVLAVCLLLDWSAKLDTPGRVVLLGAAAGLTVYALWRFLVSPLCVRLGDEELSLVVERRFPDLGDRLISTVQFARTADVAPLSREMVGQLQHDTLERTAPLNFGDVVTAKPSAYWAIGAALALIVTSLYTAWFPATAAIFAARFFNPLSTTEWPRRTQLTVLAYDKDNRPLAFEGDRVFVPKGEDVQLVVRAARHSGEIWRPPSRVTVRYRFETGGTGRRNVPMGDEAAYRTAFPTVTETFSFDVVGDDDTTRAYRVQVRTRPRVEDIRVALRAPAYTGEPEQVLPDGRGGFSALAGTVATVTVTTNKDIAVKPGNARLIVDGKTVDDMMFVGDDVRKLRGSFTLQAGQKQYAIALVDTVGLTNSPYATYRLDVRQDRPPAVQLPLPGRSKKVTPKALVPIHAVAEDKHGVTAARFVFQRGDKGKPVAHTFEAPEKPEKKIERTLDWDLTTLALKERDVLTVHAEADDAYTATLDGTRLGPNVGKSPVYRLTIIGEAEMASLLQRQQQEVKQRLRKLIARQEAAKSDTEAFAAAEEAPDRRKLKLAEREQRKIGAAATSLTDQLKGILADMKNNKVGNLEERRRVDALAKALDKAASQDMPDAARQVASAAQAKDQAAQKKDLAGAGSRQQQIADDLRAALARFDQWRDVDELLRDASELLLTQKKLNEQTAALGRKLLGKPADKLTPAEKGAARSLARAQQAARDRMQGLETKMGEVASKLEERDPAAAKIVRQAISQAAADQIRGRMDEAASRIQQARPASALGHQAKAAEALKRLVDTLDRARSPFLAQDIKKAQEQIEEQMRKVDRLLKQERRHLLETGVANLRRQLSKLRQQQSGTQAATAKAKSPQGLNQQSKGQKGHAEQAESLSRQLERLSRLADKDQKPPMAEAGEAMQKAQQKMSQAAGSLSKANQGNMAQAKAEASKAQQEAIQGLQQAERELQKLQKALAQSKPPTERLPERAKEQGETAKETRQTSEGIKKTAEGTKKTFPNASKAVEQASQKTQQAAGAMQKAEKSLSQASQQPNASGQQQQKAQQDQQDATDKLEQARQELAKAHQELDLRRRVQKLFELQKALTEMLPRQIAIREATVELDEASEGGRKPFDHAQTLELRGLADAQAKLLEAAGTIIAELEKEQAPVFLYVMRDSARLMGEVHTRLLAKQPDWMTQESEREIERNLIELLAALKSEANRLAEKKPQQQAGGGKGGGGKRQPLVAPYHQLKQLKHLQLRVNEQTRKLELDRATRRLRERLLKLRAESLGRRQDEIGKLSRDFGEALTKQNEQESMKPQ